MTNISFQEASVMLDKMKESLASLKPEPVFFYPYLKRVLTERWEKEKPEFPMTIRIAKENKYLLKGDFEPAQIITLEEPLRREDGTPVWFSSTANEAFLRFGYKNCDARYISDSKLDMEFIRATCSTISI